MSTHTLSNFILVQMLWPTSMSVPCSDAGVSDRKCTIIYMYINRVMYIILKEDSLLF